MKQLLTISLFLVSISPSYSQNLTDSLAVDSVQIFKSSKWSGYAFVFNDFSSVFNQEIDQQMSINTQGLGLATVINGRIIVGVFGTIHDEGNFTQRVVFPNSFRMKYRQNGVWIGYRFKTRKFYNFLLESRLSTGHVRWQNEFSGQDFQDTKMTIIQPTFSVDVNPLQLIAPESSQSTLQNIMRLNISISYKYVTDVDISNLRNDDFSGLSIGVMLKIGYFK